MRYYVMLLVAGMRFLVGMFDSEEEATQEMNVLDSTLSNGRVRLTESIIIRDSSYVLFVLHARAVDLPYPFVIPYAASPNTEMIGAMYCHSYKDLFNV